MKILLFLSLCMGCSVFGMDGNSEKKSLDAHDKTEQNVEGQKCAVCWDQKENKNFWKLPNCEHSFCVPCMVKLVKRNHMLCAVCRASWAPDEPEDELRKTPRGRVVTGEWGLGEFLERFERTYNGELCIFRFFLGGLGLTFAMMFFLILWTPTARSL